MLHWFKDYKHLHNLIAEHSNALVDALLTINRLERRIEELETKKELGGTEPSELQSGFVYDPYLR